MKKWLSILLTVMLAMAIGLSACSGGGSGTDDSGNGGNEGTSSGDGGGGSSGGTTSSQVTVTFESGIDSLSVPSQTIDTGSTATEPEISSDYTVFGWYTNEALTSEFSFSTAVSSNLTLYGKILKGAGTTSSPYEIGSAQSLKALTNTGYEVTGVAKLTASFTYSSMVTSQYSTTTFNGTLDGQNYTITLASASETGIFYKLGENADVSNIKIVGHIDAALGSCGVLANHNYGTVTNITTYGTTLHESSGGISNGYSDGIYSILGEVGTRADALASSSGTDAVAGAGGIVGTNYASGTVTGCLNRMNVRAKVGGGGIAAVNYGLIENCFNIGCVGTTGDAVSNYGSAYDFSYLGGMAGINYGTISQCGNLNKVFAQRLPYLYKDSSSYNDVYTNYRMNIGGIAGDNIGTVDGNGNYTGGIITECFNYGRIHGDIRVGGIAGQSNGSITYCSSYCYMGARYLLGGIVGYQKDDDYGEVSYCSSMYRIRSTSSSSITDNDGVSHTVDDLANGKVSENTDTITDYYCLAKYADHSAYHSNCGNIAPIDPDTGDKGTNKTTKGAELYNAYSVLETEGTGKWSEDVTYTTDDEGNVTTDGTTSTMVAFNTSYQIYLNVYLTWQKCTITAYDLDGNETEIDARCGIIYSEDALTYASGGYWSKGTTSYRNVSGYLPDTGLPSVTATSGYTVIWTTVKNDPSTEWDGIARGDVTLYAMLVTA